MKKFVFLLSIFLLLSELVSSQDSILLKYPPKQEILNPSSFFGTTRVAYRGAFILDSEHQDYFVATPFNPYTGEYQEIKIPEGYVAITNIFPWANGRNVNWWHKPVSSDTLNNCFYHTLKKKYSEKGAGYDSEYKILLSKTNAEEFLKVDLVYIISVAPGGIPIPFRLEKFTDFNGYYALPRTDKADTTCKYHCQSLYLTNDNTVSGINKISKSPMCGGHTIVFADGKYYLLHGGVKDIYNMLLYIKNLYGGYTELISDNGTYNVLYNTNDKKYTETGRKAAFDVNLVKRGKNHIIGTTIYVKQEP
jgi:hypothetical protein